LKNRKKDMAQLNNIRIGNVRTNKVEKLRSEF